LNTHYVIDSGVNYIKTSASNLNNPAIGADFFLTLTKQGCKTRTIKATVDSACKCILHVKYEPESCMEEKGLWIGVFTTTEAKKEERSEIYKIKLLVN